MKTESTINRKISLIAAAAFFAAGTIFQPAAALAQGSGKAATEASTPAPGLMASMYEVEPMKVRLHLVNPGATTVDISIRNDRDQVVFKESFKGATYSRILNLGTMPAGTYTLQVGNRHEGISRAFTVESSENRLTVAQAMEPGPGAGLAAVMYEVAPQKVKVHLANPSGQKINLVVRNEKSEVVLQKTLKGEQVAQILDLSQLADGAYTIQASNNSGKASRTFGISTIASRSFAWEGSGTSFTASATAK